MVRTVLIAIVLLTQTGCLRPIIWRMDRFDDHAHNFQHQLEAANAQIVESNQHMKKMAESAERLERFMKRFGGETQETTVSESPEVVWRQVSNLP